MKLTSWNVEHSSRLIGENISDINKERRKRVKATIEDINPDILCLLEAPKGEAAISVFCEKVLEKKWRPVLLEEGREPLGSNDRGYDTNGKQWIWFLVRDGLYSRCKLQAPSVWKSFTGHSRWNVHYWGEPAPSFYSHYRHPQVLLMDIGNNQELEIIGVHLKSKINRNPITRDNDGNIIGHYLTEALKARVKLATQAKDVRKYITSRFEQIPHPSIIILGDVNDGPGQDYFEKRYLHFDLIGNLQGSIMNSDQFFNHALFDFPDHLRWSAKYEDNILELSADQNPLLIDHILMSQSLVQGRSPLQAIVGSGYVEHQAFERGNAGASVSKRSSDHRPISIILTE